MLRRACLLLVLALAGCASDKDLLLEIRKHLIENVHPNYATALDEARTLDGDDLYIEEYKIAQIGVVGHSEIGQTTTLGF